MDLTNLTLDELLAQIKADSGYKEPEKEAPSAPVPVKEETVEAVEIVEEPEVIEVIEVADEPEAIETTETAVEPEKEQVIEAYEPESFLSLDDEAASDAEIIAETEEPDFIDRDEEPLIYFSEEPIETIEGAQEEAVPIFEPVTIIYEPSTPPAPLEIIDEEETVEPEHTVYEPVIPVEEKEETAEEKAKEIPSEKFEIFGNIDIESDISAMFPEIREEEQEATEKTVVVGELPDKTVIFERPGIVTGKNMFEKTADLRAVPAILSADDMLKEKQADNEKTFVRTGAIPIVAPAKPQSVHHDDGQMVLPGFGEPEEPVAQVDEDVVEDELRRNRSKKVDSFRLEGIEPEEPHIDEDIAEELGGEIKERRKRFSATKTRTRLNRQGVEYRKPSDKAKIGNYISKKRLTALIGTIISGVCALAMLVMTAVPGLSEKINEASPTVSAVAVISLVLLTVAFSVTLPQWSTGITCFFNGSGKPNARTPVFLAAAVALVQSLLLVIFDIHGEMPVFAPAAALVLCIGAAGSLLAYSRVEKNFAFLASQSRDGLYTVRTIDNIADANRIGRNVVMGEADIRYSGRTKFATNFLAYSLASDAADDLCIRLVPIAAAASVVIGIIAGIASKSVLCGLSIFAGAMCMGAPASAVLAANLPLSKANKALREDGGIITGYAGAFEYESTNAVAVDASDIFPGTSCNIHGMKTFYGVRIDDAILTAASMLIDAGGPISSLFNEVVMGRKELLMNVEEMVYEDRLGLSGWIRGRRVFVGNRKLLENHNIEIPMSVDEAKYRHDGRRVVYLADAGKIAAIFVVSYGSEPRIAEHLRKIENNGINILIRTTDSNITEEFVANTFGLPLNSVKIVSTPAGDVLKSYSDSVVPKSDAKLLHNGSAAAFLHCVSKASSLCASAGIVTTQQTFCTAAGLLLMAIITIFSGAFSVSALQICICQLVWTAISAGVSLINKE